MARCAALCALALAELQGTAQGSEYSDEYLKGYLSSILERTLDWPRGSFAIDVRFGEATLTLPAEDPSRRAQAMEELRQIEGLRRLSIRHAPLKAQTTDAGDRRVDVPAVAPPPVAPPAVALPSGDLFRPLIADPKQPQFFVSYRRYHSAGTDINAAAVGFGESFGFYRLQGQAPGDGVQISLAGGLFAQFDMDSPSSDLVNADYTIGVPITYRHGPYSARLRLYHQSSHLGDEFLLRVRPERVNLSYEAVDAIASREWGNWRGYFGGEYLLRHDPDDLAPASLHGGVEYYGATDYWGMGRFLAGLDLKSFQEHSWALDASIKAGFEIGRPDPGGRRMRLMGEAFKGYAPHGQFYSERITYYGLGMYFGF